MVDPRGVLHALIQSHDVEPLIRVILSAQPAQQGAQIMNTDNNNYAASDLNSPSGYDDKHKCAICQSRNAVTVIDTLDYVTLEAETECSKCGDKNYWAHGFFRSHNH